LRFCAQAQFNGEARLLRLASLAPLTAAQGARKIAVAFQA
jgi:hypothetical protein